MPTPSPMRTIISAFLAALVLVALAYTLLVIPVDIAPWQRLKVLPIKGTLSTGDFQGSGSLQLANSAATTSLRCPASFPYRATQPRYNSECIAALEKSKGKRVVIGAANHVRGGYRPTIIVWMASEDGVLILSREDVHNTFYRNAQSIGLGLGLALLALCLMMALPAFKALTRSKP